MYFNNVYQAPLVVRVIKTYDSEVTKLIFEKNQHNLIIYTLYYVAITKNYNILKAQYSEFLILKITSLKLS